MALLQGMNPFNFCLSGKIPASVFYRLIQPVPDQPTRVGTGHVYSLGMLEKTREDL